MAKRIEITVPANPDLDDCLSGAADEYISERPDLAGYDLNPRWEDDDRDSVILTVPVWSLETTTVRARVLSGNLGDGWRDNNEAAHALAAFMKNAWMSGLAELIDDGAKISINVDVAENTGGYADGMFVDGPLEEEVESLLTDSQQLWEEFCDSAEAEELAQ